jgi:YD repeat-containing protein
VVCVTDELGFAQFTEFSTDAGKENTPTAGSVLRKAVINKMPNLAFGGSGWIETPNGGSIAKDTSVTCLSMPSSKFVVSAAGEMTNTIAVALQWSGTYTFSIFVKTTGVTGDGAFLRVVSNGTTYESRKISTSTAELSGGPAADGWDRLSVTFPFAYGSGATSVAATLAVSGSAGTVYFSCPQMEEGVIANRPNLLLNADFTRTTVNNDNATPRDFPINWTPSSGITTSLTNGVMTSGHGMPAALKGNALRVVSAPTRDAVSFVHDVPIRGSSGDVFVVGGWLNSRSVANGANDNAPGVAYRFYIDGAWDSWRYLKANREWVGWQFACWAIKASGDYTIMQYSLHYARNSSTCMFSNMFLHREQFGNTFVYDADNNVVSASVRSGEKANMEYDAFDNLTSYVRPGAAATEEYAMTYGSTDADKKKHLLRTAATPQGVGTENTYDAKGNLTQTLNRKTTADPAIGSKTGYTTNGNYATSATDARGNTVTKAVNLTTGLTTSVTDPASTTCNIC